MRSLNKVSLIGNIGQDPEFRSTPNGSRVASFSLATTRVWNVVNGGRQEKTEWHKIVVWNRGAKGGLADTVEKYVKKGDRIYVEGAIEYRQWQDKEGATRYTTEINVHEILLLAGRPSVSDDAPAEAGTEAGYSPRALQDEDPDSDLPF